jgi:hypothetical protein
MEVTMNDPLRGCPLCGTKVRDLDLGLRDFRWVSSHLPGAVAPMDIDFVLERKGHVLMMDFKPEGVGLSVGGRMTYRTFEKMGCSVWVVQGDGPMVTLSRPGSTEGVHMHIEDLVEMVVEWWKEADGETGN